jgi:hypothetical protein
MLELPCTILYKSAVIQKVRKWSVGLFQNLQAMSMKKPPPARQRHNDNVDLDRKLHDLDQKPHDLDRKIHVEVLRVNTSPSPACQGLG